MLFRVLAINYAVMHSIYKVFSLVCVSALAYYWEMINYVGMMKWYDDANELTVSAISCAVSCFAVAYVYDIYHRFL